MCVCARARGQEAMFKWRHLNKYSLFTQILIGMSKSIAINGLQIGFERHLRLTSTCWCPDLRTLQTTGPVCRCSAGCLIPGWSPSGLGYRAGAVPSWTSGWCWQPCCLLSLCRLCSQLQNKNTGKLLFGWRKKNPKAFVWGYPWSAIISTEEILRSRLGCVCGRWQKLADARNNSPVTFAFVWVVGNPQHDAGVKTTV